MDQTVDEAAVLSRVQVDGTIPKTIVAAQTSCSIVTKETVSLVIHFCIGLLKIILGSPA